MFIGCFLGSLVVILFTAYINLIEFSLKIQNAVRLTFNIVFLAFGSFLFKRAIYYWQMNQRFMKMIAPRYNFNIALAHFFISLQFMPILIGTILYTFIEWYGMIMQLTSSECHTFFAFVLNLAWIFIQFSVQFSSICILILI